MITLENDNKGFKQAKFNHHLIPFDCFQKPTVDGLSKKTSQFKGMMLFCQFFLALQLLLSLLLNIVFIYVLHIVNNVRYKLQRQLTQD